MVIFVAHVSGAETHKVSTLKINKESLNGSPLIRAISCQPSPD